MEKSEVDRFLSEAFVKYVGPLTDELYLYTRDYALAEDCVQEALCVMQRKLYESETEILDSQSFLFSVAKKKALKYADKYAAEIHMDDIPISYEVVDETFDTEIRSIEDGEVLVKALHALLPKNRRIFVLYYVYGMSYTEIGNKVGLSGEAVRKIINRSKKELNLKI